jgi:predicted nucleic acid-binding protein
MPVLDTTVLIDAMRGPNSAVCKRAVAKLREVESRGEALRTTNFNVAELLVGVHKADPPAEERRKAEACLADLEILSFSSSAAEIFGTVVADLELRGEPISDMDALVAAVAMDNRESIVTRNVRHLVRIPGLSVESY